VSCSNMEWKRCRKADLDSGKRIETIAKALDMETLIADRKNGSSTDSSTSRTPFAEVLKKSTVLMLCLPRTPESLNLISAAELTAMSTQSVIVNVSRGGIVDEMAILAALKDGTISGYATDVLAIEPAEGPQDSPLLSEDTQSLNLTISPHVAWNGERTRRNLQKTLKEIIECFLAGKPKNVII
jgi:lactate dehydrogenase-like 2-hydroxyacid dehydrogenase